MTPTREACVRALVDSDIRAGLGDPVQIEAWRDLEWRRCKASVEYFIDNYGWLVIKEEPYIVRWVLWPKQRQLLRDLSRGKSIVAIKARQLGVTTLLINFRLWQVIFFDAARNHFVSDSEDKGKEAMTKMGATYDRLPQWMKERAVNKAKFSESKRKDRKEGTLGVAFGLSELKVLTSTPNSVAGVSGNIDLDEFGRHRDQKRILDNAIPAFLGGGQMVIIGNGNGEDELYHTYQRAKRGEFPGMEAYFFSWRDDPTRTDEWYESTKMMYLRENPERDIYSFKAQYPSTEEEAFYVTGNSFFDLKLINGLSLLTHKDTTPKAKQVELRNAGEDEHLIPRFAFHGSARGRYRLYTKPKPEPATYILGCDPVGGGVNGDYAVGTMCEFLRNGAEVAARAKLYGYDKPPKLDGERPFEFEETCWALDVACVYQHRTEPVGFALEMERFARHYNDAFAVIESNAAGGTMISHIKDSYWNLYRQVRKDTKFTDEYGEVIGYWETERSKAEMLHDLNYWLSKGWIFLHDGPTIAEMSRFGYDDRGKLKAPKGLHDDLVFGIGLCVVGARDLMLAPQDGKLVNFGLEW